MDSDHANSFKFNPGGKVDKHQIKNHDKDRRDSTHYFHEIIDAHKDAKEILIVGPGTAKTHLMSHVEAHKHNDFKKKVVGVQNMDHPTDNQILAEARKFFTKHDLFESL
jgi:stalled ribosome rescue protein Dom34